MVQKTLIVNYLELNSEKELEIEDRELLQQALNATKGSYSPYSHFCVGAAVRLSGGDIVTGSNQENSAYPSGLCAERVALFYAGAKYPRQNIKAIAITATFNGIQCEVPTNPCGACRQVLSDFENKAKQDIKIILGGTKVINVFPNVKAIMPFGFDNLPE